MDEPKFLFHENFTINNVEHGNFMGTWVNQILNIPWELHHVKHWWKQEFNENMGEKVWDHMNCTSCPYFSPWMNRANKKERKLVY
jgi:hypothetical protein